MNDRSVVLIPLILRLEDGEGSAQIAHYYIM